MFVCLSVGYTLLIKPNSIHMLYMGRSGIYRGRFLSKNELNHNNASPFMSENVTLISFYHVFLIWRRDRGYPKSPSDFSFLLCLTLRASDTLKVQTDYLTFGNLITTSDTPKVQSSEAIALNP